jgi:hypothetical protein
MPAKIKFYVDEHVSRAVVRGLRQRGADVLRVPEADFLRHHAAGVPHAGIVYAPPGTSIGVILPVVVTRESPRALAVVAT